MFRPIEPTEEQWNEWKKWVASRPPCIRDIAEKLDPWTLYRINSTGQRCMLLSIFEDRTVKVSITGEFNFVLFDCEVFGVNYEELEPCDPPSKNEVVGTALSQELAFKSRSFLRAIIRPDLFDLSKKGEAVKRGE